SSSSAGTTCSTSPRADASPGDTLRPVTLTSSAGINPTRCGNLTQPPTPGSSPSSTSGNPYRVRRESDATAAAAASAASVPPPRPAPSTAATGGLRHVSSLFSTALPASIAATTSEVDSYARNAATSPPARKVPATRDVSTAPLTPSSASSAS